LLDPDEGLLALRSVLKRDGAMQIMVYGSYGRTGIYMIREYCHVLGIATSSKELLDLRATLQAYQQIIQWRICWVRTKTTNIPTRWQMPSFTPKIVRSVCPRFTHGSTDAGCRSDAGLSKPHSSTMRGIGTDAAFGGAQRAA